MVSPHRPLVTSLALLAVLVLAACGGQTDASDAAAAPTPATPAQTSTPDMDMEMSEDMSGMSDATVGRPADPTTANRTIPVTVNNDLAFHPDTFEVTAGEIVTFTITNEGDIEHEFVIGDEAMQQAMAEQMAEGDGHAHSGDMNNAVTVHAGETAELTWEFGGPGTVLIGCHVPGHYDAGMRATVTVP